MTPGSHHWGVAALLALAIHGAALGWWLRVDRSEGARDLGTDGLQVSVGLAGSYVEPARILKPTAVAASESLPEQVAAEQVAAEHETAEHETPEHEMPVQETSVDEAPAEEAPAERVAVAEPATLPPSPQQTRPQVAVEPAAAPRPAPEVTAKRRPAPKPDAPAKTQPQAAPMPPPQVDDTKNDDRSRSSVLATGSGQRVETGGNPAARQSYLAEVLAQIARHKRYPREARHDGVTGVVSVTFTILANGTVDTEQVSGSSGDHRLDQAALAMLSRASPFPPIPRNLGMPTLELTLPVEFSLNKKRKTF